MRNVSPGTVELRLARLDQPLGSHEGMVFAVLTSLGYSPQPQQGKATVGSIGVASRAILLLD